ncbi:MAG: glycosyltransferase family 1 protein [Gammaproteobacteria bacterium]|nr:glycosyltransferase family 1 protein [Gammaproteobacteria bacterium]
MKITVITYGTEGDNRPLVALCRGLQNSGHDILFLGERSIEGLATRSAIPFQALEGDMKATVQPGGPLHRLMNEKTHPGVMAKACANFATENTKSWMKSLLSAAQDSDGIIFSGFAGYTALSVAEYLNKPVIGAGLFPVSPTKEFPSSLIPSVSLPGWLNYYSHKVMMSVLWHLFRRSINEARKEICNQPARWTAWSDYPIVYGISPSLLPQPQDWPDKWKMCGAWYQADSLWSPSQELVAFINAGEPPIYVGFGSMSGFDSKRLLNIFSPVLAGRRVIYAPGWSEYDASLLPVESLIVDNIPHDWLFPRVSLVIHHGGAGTSHAAAIAGTPSVVIPFAGDQFFWAHRLTQLGVAPKSSSLMKVNATIFKKMLEAASSQVMIENSRALAQRMKSEDGVGDAVQHVERFIRQ